MANLKQDIILDLEERIWGDHSQLVRLFIGTLTARETKILEMRFGLGSSERSHTLEEVGQEFGLTRERIRQIEAKAISKLKKISGALGKLSESESGAFDKYMFLKYDYPRPKGGDRNDR